MWSPPVGSGLGLWPSHSYELAMWPNCLALVLPGSLSATSHPHLRQPGGRGCGRNPGWLLPPEPKPGVPAPPHMLHHRLLHGLEMHPFSSPHRRPCDSTPCRRHCSASFLGTIPGTLCPSFQEASWGETIFLPCLRAHFLGLCLVQTQHLPLSPAEGPRCRRMGSLCGR